MLAAGVAGAAAITLPSRVRPAGLDPRAWARAAAAKTAFRKPLRIPPVLSASQLEIEMREAKVAVLPGKKTKMWTYGGSFPGPTIRRPAGERTEVTFVHSLPAKAGELTVHLHGGPQPLLRGRTARRADREPAAGAVLRHLLDAGARRLG